MKDITNNNNIPSFRERAMMDKEYSNQKSITEEIGSIGNQKHLVSGIKNPCVFGNHNQNFRSDDKRSD